MIGAHRLARGRVFTEVILQNGAKVHLDLRSPIPYKGLFQVDLKRQAWDNEDTRNSPSDHQGKPNAHHDHTRLEAAASVLRRACSARQDSVRDPRHQFCADGFERL